ncbi:MAG: hypothetical protein LBM78_00800 [Clostridiales bacterium]|jgi:ABC-2 type transport system permease protein|nr:hypothetical protein [Clostridiales bacterium]
MTHYLQLTKLFIFMRLKEMFRSRARKGGFIATLVIVGVSGAMLLVGLAAAAAAAGYFLPARAGDVLMLLYVMAGALVTVFGMVPTMTTLYYGKDSRILAPLPVKPQTVFLSKLTVVYIYEFLATALMLFVPGVSLGIALGISSGVGIMYFVGLLLSLFFVPAIPMLLCVILAIPLMYIVSFFKSKGAASTIVMMTIMLLVMGVYFTGIVMVQNFSYAAAESTFDITAFDGALAGISEALKPVFFPLYALAAVSGGMRLGDLPPAASTALYLLIGVACVAALVSLAAFVARFGYRRGAMAQFEHGGGKTKEGDYRAAGPLKALMKLEWNRILKTPSVGMQCLLGCGILPIILIAYRSIAGIQGNNIPAEDIGALPPTLYTAIQTGVATLVLMMMIVSTCTAAMTTFSREGTLFKLTKLYPVPYRTQVSAKRNVSLIISGVGLVLGLSAAQISYRLPVYFLAFLVLFMTAYLLAITAVCLRFDLSAPKLEWNAPVDAIKRNGRATGLSLALIVVGLVFGLLISAALVIVTFFPQIEALLMSLVLSACLAAAALAAYLANRSLLRNADRLYTRVEV